MSEGVLLLPTGAEWMRLFLFLVLAFVFLRFLGTKPAAAALTMFVLVAAVAAAVAIYPVITSRTLASAWFGFLGLMLLIGLAELADRRSPVADVARGP